MMWFDAVASRPVLRTTLIGAVGLAAALVASELHEQALAKTGLRSALAELGEVILFASASVTIVWSSLFALRERDRAIHDPLTGLANVALLREVLARTLAQAARDGNSGVAMLSCDLDDFKGINDTLGHPVGDAVLRGVATRLLLLTRPMDLVARVGGDEFVVLCAGATTRGEVQKLVKRVSEFFSAPLVIDGKVIPVRVSVGAKWCDARNTDLARLIREVDRALYRAKRRRKRIQSPSHVTTTPLARQTVTQ